MLLRGAIHSVSSQIPTEGHVEPLCLPSSPSVPLLVQGGAISAAHTAQTRPVCSWGVHLQRGRGYRRRGSFPRGACCRHCPTSASSWVLRLAPFRPCVPLPQTTKIRAGVPCTKRSREKCWRGLTPALLILVLSAGLVAITKTLRPGGRAAVPSVGLLVGSSDPRSTPLFFFFFPRAQWPANSTCNLPLARPWHRASRVNHGSGAAVPALIISSAVPITPRWRWPGFPHAAELPWRSARGRKPPAGGCTSELRMGRPASNLRATRHGPESPTVTVSPHKAQPGGRELSEITVLAREVGGVSPHRA